MKYVVRRSGANTAIMFVLLCGIFAMGIYGLGIFQPAPGPGERGFGVLALAIGAIGLFLLWRRTRRPAEELTIDGYGINWWKVPRTIGWEEIAEVRLDSAKSQVFLYLKLTGRADVGAMEIAHPIEILGNVLTGSDLTIRLSGTDCRLAELDEALLRLKAPNVTLTSPVDR